MMKKYILILIIFCLSVGPAFAEESDSTVSKKELEHLYETADGVYVSEFMSYKFSETQSPQNTLVATYRCRWILKGPNFRDIMKVRYDLDPSVSNSDRKDIEKNMPTKGSQWILFFTLAPSDGLFKTTEGSKGRVKNTAVNLYSLMRGTVVYSVKPIPKKTKLTKDMFCEKSISQAKIPGGAVAHIYDLLGRIAQYDIPEGIIIPSHYASGLYTKHEEHRDPIPCVYDTSTNSWSIKEEYLKKHRAGKSKRKSKAGK